MIKVSHEMPLDLLKKGYSSKYNDYEYALVHLFEESKDYYNYYVQSLREGRLVYLDNSIFELGESFESEKFVYWLEKLYSDGRSNNIVYIIPDVLDDYEATVQSTEGFIERYGNLPGQAMAVMQGSSIDECIACYDVFRRLKIEIIGISFNSKAYDNEFPYIQNILQRWVEGRRYFIKELLRYDPDLEEKKLHLLGCALPQEFKYYSENNISKFILSLDTSNPVVHGIQGIKYKDHGLDEKESIKLVDLIGHICTEEQASLIKYNLGEFRRINSL